MSGKTISKILLAGIVMLIFACNQNEPINPILQFHFNVKPSTEFSSFESGVGLVAVGQIINGNIDSRSTDMPIFEFEFSELGNPQSKEFGGTQTVPSKLEAFVLEFRNSGVVIDSNLILLKSKFGNILGSTFETESALIDLEFDKTYAITFLLDLEKSIEEDFVGDGLLFDPEFEILIEEK